MIYKTNKYKSIRDFILRSNDYKVFEYSLPIQTCNAISQSFEINNSCFYCNFCAFGEIEEQYREKLQDISPMYDIYNFFKGNPIKLPNARFYAKNPINKNLETYTSIEETKRIQLWSTAILSHCTQYETISSIEIPAPNESFDRDGRIDIGIIESNILLFVETKTTLADAMADERFVEQHSKYTPVIEETIATNDEYLLCILIGGKETDLYPPNNPFCSGKVGNLSKRFYKLLKSNERRIPFVSANALWLLSLKYLEDNTFSVNKFLLETFKDSNCFGLTTAGKIIKTENNNFIIEKIDIKKGV